jgi:hypothetical protein
MRPGSARSERRQQAQRENPLNNLRKLGDLVYVPTDHQNLAVWQWMDSEAHLLHLAADPNHRGVGRNVRRKARRQAFDVAGEAMTVGPEQSRDLDATGILVQSIVDFCQSLTGSSGDVRFGRSNCYLRRTNRKRSSASQTMPG